MNEYLIAIYGWLFFNIVTLGLAKDEQDNLKKGFNVKSWWKYNWDNVVVTLFAIPVLVWMSEDIWVIIINDWLGKPWPYNKISLMASVPLVQLVYYLIRKFKK